MGFYHGVCVFAIFYYEDEWKCISNKTVVHHVMVWNFLYYVNPYPVAVVKYLYIILKHFGRSLMPCLFADSISKNCLFADPISTLIWISAEFRSFVSWHESTNMLWKLAVC